MAALVDKGSFVANATVAGVFNGKATLRGLSGSLLDPNLALRGYASIDGIDISQAASFDGLVNDKLKGIPGVGNKANVSTGGMAAEISTKFSINQGIAKLDSFQAITPKRDEMRLAGTMSLNFDCDLSGEAH